MSALVPLAKKRAYNQDRRMRTSCPCLIGSLKGARPAESPLDAGSRFYSIGQDGPALVRPVLGPAAVQERAWKSAFEEKRVTLHGRG